MTGLVRRVAVRQIVPRSAGAQNPEHAVQYGARALPCSAPTMRLPLRAKQELEQRRLGVGELA